VFSHKLGPEHTKIKRPCVHPHEEDNLEGTDISTQNSVKPMFRGQRNLYEREIGAVAQWQRAYLACARSWVPAPALQENNKQTTNAKNRFILMTGQEKMAVYKFRES
jgi:hypothetical protein